MNGRITEIEGIRGLLSLIVVIGHVYILDETLFWYGGCMEVFFCISGFVITRLLFENLGRKDFLKSYFIRRALRIWPMYFVAMGFAYAVTVVTDGSTLLPPFGMTGDWRPSLGGILLPFAFLQNTEIYLLLSPVEYLKPFQHSWSVAVEEHFYTFWPFLLLLLMRRIPVSVRLLIAVAAVSLSIVMRAKGWHPWLLLTRLDGFVFGVALAYLEAALQAGRVQASSMERLFKWAWLWPCLALIPYMTHGYFGIEWSLPPVLMKTVLDPFFNFALLGFCVVGNCVFVSGPGGAKLNLHRVLNWAWLQRLGTISYSTYLLHVPIVFVISPYLISNYQLPSIFSLIIGLGLTLVLANMTYPLIEARAMRLKKYFRYAGSEGKRSSRSVDPQVAQPNSQGKPPLFPTPAAMPDRT